MVVCPLAAPFTLLLFTCEYRDSHTYIVVNVLWRGGDDLEFGDLEFKPV